MATPPALVGQGRVKTQKMLVVKVMHRIQGEHKCHKIRSHSRVVTPIPLAMLLLLFTVHLLAPPIWGKLLLLVTPIYHKVSLLDTSLLVMHHPLMATLLLVQSTQGQSIQGQSILGQSIQG